MFIILYNIQINMNIYRMEKKSKDINDIFQKVNELKKNKT